MNSFVPADVSNQTVHRVASPVLSAARLVNVRLVSEDLLTPFELLFAALFLLLLAALLDLNLGIDVEIFLNKDSFFWS